MKQSNNSITNQKKLLQKAAKDKGYEETIFFVDNGITGTTPNRPGFQQMLKAIEAGYISAGSSVWQLQGSCTIYTGQTHEQNTA